MDFAEGSGWSAAAILAATLSWLFLKHLPAVFKQNEEARQEFTKSLNDMRLTFEGAVKDVVAHCLDEMKMLRK